MVLLKKPEHGKIAKIMIIGAGEGGQLIARHILENPDLNYNLVGFVDDDISKIGKNICGVPVYGSIVNINEILSKNNIDEILIAAPSLPGEIIRKIFESLRGIGIKIKILPSSFETYSYMEEGKADFEPVRDLRIEDFFRRKPVISDYKQIRNNFSNQIILVTGAAGSIGSELCRQLLRLGATVIALDNRETALHEFGLELKEKYDEKIITSLADIRDKSRIKKVFEKYKPSIIFHAAAYKHVPMTEAHPDEAVKTNIFGTQNLVELVDELKINTFILISTDKSANPECTLGFTKGIAEIVTKIKSKKSNSKFLTVRFGNVLNSDGSIVPLFEKQIRNGDPVTVTHPEAKRFFMTIPEAVQLVINSVLIGKNGELFILDMGEQHNILKLAETVIKLNGLEPYKDIEIKIIGNRKGDKMEEVLLNSNELKERTENSRIFSVKNGFAFDEEEIKKDLDELKIFAEESDSEKIVSKLKKILMKENNEFIPYNLPSIDKEEIDEITDTLKSNWLTMGPKTIKFEKEFADYIKVKNAISVNSCTAAMHLSLIALGIKEGDEIITSPFTFAATGNVICHVGAKPIFVDIDEKTFNIDTNKIEKAITNRTKAIIVVHYGGQSADLDEIKNIADKYNLKIIEDAAHAVGSDYKGKKIGSFGNLVCYSFYATKNMTTGEGGMIVTNDNELADKLRILRLHGISKDAWKRYEKEGNWYYEIQECGWKYNMTDIQASLGLPQLKKLEKFIERRKEIAKKYNEELSNISGIKIPFEKENRTHGYHLYPILLETYDRNKFIEEMSKKNIGTSVHFIPLHLHPFYQRTFGYKEGDFPVAEKIYKRIVSLPLYPSMSNEKVLKVTEIIKKIMKKDNLRLRLVNPEDCRFLYEWRNHPNARVASRFTKEIPYEEHMKWFSDSLNNQNRKIYIALEDEQRIGQVRFDKENGEAEVSITINPERYGQGYGSALIKMCSEKYFAEESDIEVLRAEIRPENPASIKIFQNSGYNRVGEKQTPHGPFDVFKLYKPK